MSDRNIFLATLCAMLMVGVVIASCQEKRKPWTATDQTLWAIGQDDPERRTDASGVEYVYFSGYMIPRAELDSGDTLTVFSCSPCRPWRVISDPSDVRKIRIAALEAEGYRLVDEGKP